MQQESITPDLDQREHSRALLEKLIEICECNTAELKATRKDLDAVRELLSAWQAAQGAIRVIYLVGNTVRWLTMVAAAFTACIYGLRWLIGMK